MFCVTFVHIIHTNLIVDYYIIFNTKKTICIKYGDAVKPQECAKLNDTRLSWGEM